MELCSCFSYRQASSRLLQCDSESILIIGEPPEVAAFNPEAVCVIGSSEGERSLLLISDDGGNSPSSYVLIPISRLK